MRIGVPTEVKESEYRVAITPAGVRELTIAGHDVAVEAGAGRGSSLTDDDYERAGATIVAEAAAVWDDADVVLKVKEPLPSEYAHFRDDLVLFTYLHLAADKDLTQALVDTGTTAIAYETVTDPYGGLPLLAPMSEVAGRMAPQVGAHALMAPTGGRGVLSGGVSGVLPAQVVVVGAGTAGSNAAQIATGMEADVTVLDLDIARLRQLDSIHHGRLTTLMSNKLTLEEQVARADLVIGAVLVPGALAPVVITEEMVAGMQPGAVLVDISIDQGGCAATSRMTTHTAPTYVTHGVVHYCVGNMPGAVPRTSTYALTNLTLRYVVRLADAADDAGGGRGGVAVAAQADPGFAEGINVAAGAVTNAGVAEAHGLSHRSVAETLGLD